MNFSHLGDGDYFAALNIRDKAQGEYDALWGTVKTLNEENATLRGELEEAKKKVGVYDASRQSAWKILEDEQAKLKSLQSELDRAKERIEDEYQRGFNRALEETNRV